MAATIGPDMMAETPKSDHFDHAGSDTSAGQNTGDTSPQLSPRSHPPPPNPPFVFPARPPSSSSAPSSFSRATGRRPRSAIEPREQVPTLSPETEKPKSRSPALPAFSFNPGASLPSTPGPESAFLSPPQSPSAPGSPRTAAARPAGAGHGHRRGGSEFVGGNIRAGDSITVMNTSPTKSESGMSSPLLQPTKPPGRRGHAHRRSAAISSHDLSSIILPSPSHSLRGNSAPASPAMPERPGARDFGGKDQTSEPNQDENIVSETEIVASDQAQLPVVELEPAPRPAARNRVGFSDTLEYIPRPLSLVSSDTSSTITARPGHSVSGSISSVISITNTDRELSSPTAFTSARKPSDSRPSTAGAVLERSQSSQEQDPALRSPRRRGSIPFLGELPPTTAEVAPPSPSPTKSGKKWSFFGLDPFVTASPTRSSRPDSPSSSELQSAASTAESCPADQTTAAATSGISDVPQCQKTSIKKRKKKVKTWAGSILIRKQKQRLMKAKRRAPTPPLRPGHLENAEGQDSSIDCMSPEPEQVVPIFTVTDSSGDDTVGDWEQDQVIRVPDEDTSYPMIDLDAALGPFNTPLPRNPEWEAAQRAGGHVKKQLHSAAGMSRFSGPGMHYHHRRAESAPEMVPFEGGRFGFRRFGSSSTMADVFEEDEEDEENDSDDSTPAVGTPTAEKTEAGSLTEATSQETSQATSPTSVSDSTRPEGASVSGVDCDLEPAGSSMEQASVKATLPRDPPTQDPSSIAESSSPNRDSGSTTPSPTTVFRPRDLAPVDLGPLSLPPASLAPISPYSTTQSSSAFPSPRSPMSYDAHRISTAPSSITEDNFQSLLHGEPGPEVRISVDDIPSLTSSNSTMTRESILAQNPQARYPPLGDHQRPASFTSTAFGRRRSSLASLSRLISSSHGERSKLSMELTLESEPEKKAKLSKAKRLSRMVQFWKPKDNNAT